MASIKFDEAPERLGEHGVNKCLIRYGSTSYPWNGIIGITEERESKNPSYIYLDGRRVNSQPVIDNRNYTIECFTYPEIVDVLLGIHTTDYGLMVENQGRKKFDMIWVSNLVDGVGNKFKKLNFLYNAYLMPSDVNYQTDSTNAHLQTFKMSLEVYPTDFGAFGDQYKVVIDERNTPKDFFSSLENDLYGTDQSDPVWYDSKRLIGAFSDQNYKVGEKTKIDGLYNITPGDYFKGNTREGLFRYIQNTDFLETSTNGLYK